MFEPYRKYTSCIFCSEEDLTREHLFGHSFAQRLGISMRWQAIGTQSDEAFEEQVRKGSCPLTNVAPRLLCTKCNEEKLSGSMNESLPYLDALCSGQEIETLEDVAKDALRRYFERFAMIVDVCTSNEQIEAAPPKRSLTRASFERTQPQPFSRLQPCVQEVVARRRVLPKCGDLFGPTPRCLGVVR